MLVAVRLEAHVVEDAIAGSLQGPAKARLLRSFGSVAPDGPMRFFCSQSALSSFTRFSASPRARQRRLRFVDRAL
jgi:hypothetical protein